MPEIKTKEAVQKQKPKLKSPQQWGAKARRVYQFRKAVTKNRQTEEQAGNEHETATEYAASMTEQATQDVVYELGRIPHGAAAAIKLHQVGIRDTQQSQEPMSSEATEHTNQWPTLHSSAPRTSGNTASFHTCSEPFSKQTMAQYGKTEGAVSTGYYPGIRERPMGNPTPKQKPSIEPKIRTNSHLPVQKKAVPTVRLSPVHNASIAHRATELGRQRFIQNTQRRIAQQIPQAAKATADFAKNAVIAISKSIQAAVGLLTGIIGGAGLAAVFLLAIMVGAFIASPFGIFFSNEPYQDSIPLNAAVSQINIDFSNRLDALQDGDYDNITTTGNPPDWREVVAVYASRTAGADDGVDVATFDAERVERLRSVFWDMCSVSSSVETVEHPDSDPEDEVDDSWTEKNLYITISAQTADEMRTAYAFTEYQNKALDELLSEMPTLNYLLGNLSISQEDAIAVLQNLPADLSTERRAVVQHALSLVGKVNYFWGGKSLVLGWDSRWGQIEMVWAAGSRTTGTYRPYGLDCSGLVDWVFYNASGGNYVIGHGGGAGSQHRYCTSINWSEAQPGDLVFYPNDDHVGIVGGRDTVGNLLIIHCASGQNNVVITGISGFSSIGRPLYYSEQ